MGQLKTSFIALAVIIVAIVLAGCASSTPAGEAGKPLVVATIGAPTPVPTEPPEPTPGPTWVPSPTPRPPPVTLSDYSLKVTINGDQRPVSGDPDQDLQLDTQHAIRQDTVKFKIQNTGDATLNDLDIIYLLVTPTTFVDSYSGQESTAYRTQTGTQSIGVLQPGESIDVTFVSPPYGAMLEANVTITAKWDNGSLELYKATLEPNFQTGSYVSPANQQQVMTHGSANN
jgi:hypothetical protein